MKVEVIKWSCITLLFSVGLIVLYLALPKLEDAKHEPKCAAPCKSGAVCMNTPFLWTSILNVTCVPIQKKAPVLNIKLPFKAHVKVFCTHAPGVGTHSWPNAYWALDLAIPYHNHNPRVYASATGIAYISHVQCPEPSGSAAQSKISPCGEGFGNWVKIYHGNGYYTFYAHLDHTLVKNGSLVQQGQPIGEMGWTGNAGHRHLHWSTQRLPGKNEAEWRHTITNYMGESVPFDFLAMQSNKLEKFDIRKVQCEHVNIGSTVDSQPTFNGVF
ncbi:MAG: M23 family metallopeptidase [Legionellaceae bacterium]|nr:M23 family metallopeptidase [Legionellaceae bacterium]